MKMNLKAITKIEFSGVTKCEEIEEILTSIELNASPEGDLMVCANISYNGDTPSADGYVYLFTEDWETFNETFEQEKDKYQLISSWHCIGLGWRFKDKDSDLRAYRDETRCKFYEFRKIPLMKDGPIHAMDLVYHLDNYLE